MFFRVCNNERSYIKSLLNLFIKYNIYEMDCVKTGCDQGFSKIRLNQIEKINKAYDEGEVILVAKNYSNNRWYSGKMLTKFKNRDSRFYALEEVRKLQKNYPTPISKNTFFSACVDWNKDVYRLHKVR